MKSLVSSIRLQYNENNQPELVIGIKNKETLQELGSIKELLTKDKQVEIEIKKKARKRSLDSNSYLWILCQKIAEKIGSTKEHVYQVFIKRVGQFEIVPIKNEAVERWIEIWISKGLGWHAEVLEDSKLPGYKKVISYYGSSVYLMPEMQVLVNEVVMQCKELDIETKPEAEVQSLINSWNRKENYYEK